ncbi:MAG: hypothetical protein C4K60_08030 [Ideonella sp. MAG2]|nr:MAG: hypothetical protein C4K60_08030 [Ideonella sp. MAG2]
MVWAWVLQTELSATVHGRKPQKKAKTLLLGAYVGPGRVETLSATNALETIMNTPSRPSFLRRLMGHSAPAPEFDAGDMGTAFGMDYCLDQRPLEPLPSPAEVAEAERQARVWSFRRDRN